MTVVAPEASYGAPWVVGALVSVVVAGCASTSPPEPSRCEALIGVGGVHSLRLAAEEGTIAAQLVVPHDALEEAPVVVQVFGAWDPAVLPGGEHTTLDRVVTLRVALADAEWGDGGDDLRGPQGRAAVAAALRYAAGQDHDTEDCAVVDRAPIADPSTRLVFAQSNGGNLVMATLGDTTLDVPEPVGVVLWETPAGAGFVDMEHGNSEALYAEGSCTFGAASGVSCPFRPGVELLVQNGPCFDVDGDHACTDADVHEHAPTDPSTGLNAGSPTLAEAFVAAGLHPDWDDTTQSAAFWAERDAARAAPAAIARFPDLPFLLLASETDHVLYGLGDHPHVYGLGEALQTAGARWVRLNPGETWSRLGSENVPNLPLRLSDPTAWLLTEQEENPLSGVATRAVNELVERSRDDNWE